MNQKFAQMTDIINIHFFAIVFAVVGFVYAMILTEPNMILNGVWNYLDKTLPEWLFKPIIGCYKCVCGQMALWSGFYFVDYTRPLFEIITLHVYFICLTILISIVINKIYESKEY